MWNLPWRRVTDWLPKRMKGPPSRQRRCLCAPPCEEVRKEGVLPTGDYSISGIEEGYFAVHRRLRIGSGAGPSERVVLELPVDENHPRWPTRPTGHVWVMGWAGAAVGPSLRSGPESDCRAGCDDALAWGATGGARVGYELPWPLSVELMAGYATLWTRPRRGATTTYESAAASRSVEYELKDVIRFKGPSWAQV